MMNSCQGCKYWSERVAQAGAGLDHDEVEAMCMHEKEAVLKYTYLGCEDYEAGQALDDPARERG